MRVCVHKRERKVGLKRVKDHERREKQKRKMKREKAEQGRNR